MTDSLGSLWLCSYRTKIARHYKAAFGRWPPILGFPTMLPEMVGPAWDLIETAIRRGSPISKAESERFHPPDLPPGAFII